MRRGVHVVTLLVAASAVTATLAGKANDVRKDAFKLLNEGVAAYNRADYRSAIVPLQKAAAISLNSFAAHHYLGLALADYPGFRDEGFEIVALLDTVRDKIGDRSRAGVPIYDVREFRKLVRREHIRIAVIAVPAEAAQAVVNMVVSAGVKAVLNFSPGTLDVPPDVKLKSVDLTVSLESLSFFLAQGDDDA